MSREIILSDLCCCHAQRRIDTWGPANHSLGMTPAIKLYSVAFIDYILWLVLYRSFLWYDNDKDPKAHFPTTQLIFLSIHIRLFNTTLCFYNYFQPRQILRVSKPRVPGSKVSKYTLKRRSQQNDKYMEIISGQSSEKQRAADINIPEIIVP